MLNFSGVQVGALFNRFGCISKLNGCGTGRAQVVKSAHIQVPKLHFLGADPSSGLESLDNYTDL